MLQIDLIGRSNFVPSAATSFDFRVAGFARIQAIGNQTEVLASPTAIHHPSSKSSGCQRSGPQTAAHTNE